VNDTQTKPKGFDFDKRINIPTIVSVLSTFALIVALFVTVRMEVQYLKAEVEDIKCDVREAQATGPKVIRIEEQIKGLGSILIDIKNELRAAREARK